MSDLSVKLWSTFASLWELHRLEPLSQVSGIPDLNGEDLSERTMLKLLKLDKSVFSSESEEYIYLPGRFLWGSEIKV